VSDALISAQKGVVSMTTISESNVLLRADVPLPAGFKVATDEFHQGWNRMRSGGAGRLDKKIKARGWSFTRAPGGTLRSGVGKTAQEAIGSALCQALAEMDQDSHAVEVGQMQVTSYPWFFVARVRVEPYRIQPVVVNEQAMPATAVRSANAPGLYTQYGSTMPLLRG
jgi:hypothetical protein